MLLFLLLLAVGFIVFSTTKLKLHPFLALLLTALAYGLAAGMNSEELLTSVKNGFGGTVGGVGLIIVLGVIIGAFLEKSGGARALAEWVIGKLGERRIPLGMSLIGYIVSIPVFCDSGFIILSSLAKALTKKTGQTLAATAVALALGLLASHAMVPPTPGPIATAGILGADIGLVIFWGIIISLLSLIPCLFFAQKVAAKTWISPETVDGEKEETSAKHSPSPFQAMLPILVPIVLIVLKSFNDYLKIVESGFAKNLIDLLGAPVIALLVGLGLALFLPQKLEKEMLSTQGWVGKALTDAAVILMITGAGGIFGKVLQNSGLAEVIGSALGEMNWGIWLPFLIAAALKTAQGSSTVAMITTASIVAPLLGPLGFETEISKALAVLAIGAGSVVVSHANDSFFWVVTQMTGMDVSQGYRLHTTGTAVLGSSAVILIFLASLFLT